MNNPLHSGAARAILESGKGEFSGQGFNHVTDQRSTRIPQFFLTPGGPCPYLPGKTERKVFARLGGNLAQPLSEALTHSGFRRSQSIAYRPACEGCIACVSVRVRAGAFAASRNQKRILRRGEDLARAEVAAEATREQFALLRTYLDSRHPGGGMSDMGLFDYVAMVEETPVDTHIVEYRKEDGTLVACALTDRLKDGLSMVYSFFHPGEEVRSLGTYMILDHVRAAQAQNLPYVYLGYWVRGSDKMDYKIRFSPLEALGQNGWEELAL